MNRLGPQPGPQTMFAQTPADIANLGGAAGGGKTMALLLETVRHIANPGYGAVVLRRTKPEIVREGGMWDESMRIFPLVDGVPRPTEMDWRFPSGARIKFAHMQYEMDKLGWQGSQIPLICWDELTHFTQGQFVYMLSRNRSTCGIAPYMRSTCNPDPDSWVADFFSWWIDQRQYLEDGQNNPNYGLPIKERAGVLRWFVRDGSRFEWADTPQELTNRYPQAIPKSVTFIPATVYDNQILMKADPGYVANLQAQDPIMRARLLDGNWKVRAGRGDIFNRNWFEIVDAVPPGGIDCRFWDLAATEKSYRLRRQGAADFTAGVKIRRTNDAYWIMDVVELRIGPAQVEELVKTTAYNDKVQAESEGASYMLRWEQEPGGAGKREAHRLATEMEGYDAKGIPSSGDKISRARPLATQAREGRVKVLHSLWNENFLNHMHNQPEMPFDDIMDASAGAFNELVHAIAAPIVAPDGAAQSSRWSKTHGARRHHIPYTG